MEEVASSSISVDGGESLETAGDVGGEWRLADILQTLQLTNQDPENKNKRPFTSPCPLSQILNQFINNGFGGTNTPK